MNRKPYRNTSSQHYEYKPRGVLQNWNLRRYNADEITRMTTDIISRVKKGFDEVGSAKILSADTVLRPLIELNAYVFCAGSLVTFPRHVSECQHIRDAALEATRLLDKANIEINLRKDVFDNLVAYRERYSFQEHLSFEEKRCLDDMIRNGRRNGLHLHESVLQKIKAVKKRIIDLQLQFTRNLAEEDSYVLFSQDELIGVPYSFLDTLEIDETTQLYKVRLTCHNFFPIIRSCRNPETRRIMEYRYNSKCLPDNTNILEEILELKQQEAELLGYPNHSAYIQDILMAKHPQNVKSFLLDLKQKLKPVWKLEKDHMLKLKKKECEVFGYPFNNRLDPWDFRYYMAMVEEELYSVDKDEVREYFPLEFVTRQMMKMFERVLNLKFVKIVGAQKWNDDVRVYRVNDQNKQRTLGYIYLDLFLRPGKFGNACCVPLQVGCLKPNGKRQCAVAAMLTNFNRPMPGKPSLLDHKEVEQYFHEFGHMMHSLCSKAETAYFFGTRVETDFVEAPSQMLENWVWHPESLFHLTRHFETGIRMPPPLMEKLILSRRANAAALNLRQVVLAVFDQEIHSQGRCDTRKVYAKIQKDIMGIDSMPGTNMPANFTHLCVGYSGRYYSYLWSEVFSMDMFMSTFARYGCFNREIGLKYRECILEPGGAMGAEDMLRNFLGREPSNLAFLESKGLPFK